MTISSQEYWLQRTRERNKILDGYENAFMRKMTREYSSLLSLYRSRIATFYTRYADRSGILDPASAARPIIGRDLEQFKQTLERLRPSLSLTADIRLQKEIEKALRRKTLSRFEKLMLQMDIATHKVAQAESVGMTATLTKEMEEAYLFAAYSVDRAIGTTGQYGALRKQRISAAINNPWSGRNYSSRIWSSKERLITSVQEIMVRGQTQGLLVKDLTKQLSGRMGVQLADAERLIRTESTYIANQASIDLYNTAGFDWYEYVAVDDGRTSTICLDLDEEIFELPKGTPGINMPPMHPNCRSSIAPAPDKKALQINPEERKFDTYEDWKKSRKSS